MAQLTPYLSMDQIYSGGLLNDLTCSVCLKTFKKEIAAQKHIQKRNCHKYLDMFRDTETELSFLDTYMSILGTLNKNAQAPSLVSFRKSTRIYNAFARLYLFCFERDIHYIDYLEFCFKNYHVKNIVNSFSYFIKESNISKYFDYKRDHLTENDNERYFLNNKQFFHNFSFTVRSLERGNIQYQYLFSQINFDEFIMNLSNLEKNRMKSFLAHTET